MTYSIPETFQIPLQIPRAAGLALLLALAFTSQSALAQAASADHSAAHGVDSAHPHAQHNQHDPRALADDPQAAEAQLAPLLDGLGDHHHAVTTKSPRAQTFFDQGLKLTYGFNHQEALRSFKEAARLDPDCAMAYWGWALVLGPNLNLPMRDDVVDQAYEAIQRAVSLKSKVGQKEQDFIDALAVRYRPIAGGSASADRGALDLAYALAMRRLYEKYPSDNDAATLFAAAWMNVSPWSYWHRDGRARDHTPDILAALEGVFERDPYHEGALHYYIHAVESADADRGVAAADRLRGLAPGAGHLSHMPSHIDMQVGRYADAYEANVQAAKADEGYLAQCRAQGIYPLNYYPHNVHFLAWAAIMRGHSADAMAAADKVAAQVPADMHGNDWGLYQTFLSMPLYTLVRFGKWQEILDVPPPADELILWSGIWHYARGMALTHTGQLETARAQLATLERTANDPEAVAELIGFSSAGTLLSIAADVLAGEIAAKAGDYDLAIARLDRAVRLEDSLLYNEPPDWYYPVRHTLGAVLLDAGRPREAETVYWQDLSRHRDNGYALLGLSQAQAAKGSQTEADETLERFRQAWDQADVELTSSRF